ncbi:AAA family ATPase [Psychrosphaera algicola]|uniref:AAA family ATPase n=1 Tax=Psychrosphaera algicola TaxID=3023714 RepID=A0ABT5FFP0_9GAMM|nr:AAA family ATPase [Psychrosphaera sp. G1-22]MDC2889854.1 AAA family ATPase [Psychrosphaera sp. G1-22]
MLVKSVIISNFRNIESANLITDKTVNVFYGKNGGGKTSVLEALFYLGRAKSFRTSKRKTLVNNDSERFAVSAGLVQHGNEHRLGIGLELAGESLIKLDGEVVSRLSEASSLFPTQVITPESFDVFLAPLKHDVVLLILVCSTWNTNTKRNGLSMRESISRQTRY